MDEDDCFFGSSTGPVDDLAYLRDIPLAELPQALRIALATRSYADVAAGAGLTVPAIRALVIRPESS